MIERAEGLLSKLLAARSTSAIDALLEALPIVPPEQFQWVSAHETSAPWKDRQLHWMPVGLDRGNGGRIKLAGEPMNPLAERLVNGMESLIELARLRELKRDKSSQIPLNPRDAVARYFGFPRLDLIEGLPDSERKRARELVDETKANLSITLDHDKKSKEFAVTVRDQGMGQTSRMIHKTLLSLGRTEKADKPYLIGVFGQGGSSAFSISKYSVVISRRAADLRGTSTDGGVGWSIVREIHPKGRRDPYFAYLASSSDGSVPEFAGKEGDEAGFKQGAHFCHVGYDFAGGDSAVARSMYQSLNHVLFNPVMPYELYALKDTPEPMLGTAQRLARRVRLASSPSSLDKAFSALKVN